MQQMSKIHNRPMKSPSPDIANRNQIKDTKAPIDDVKRYLQKCPSSRSPRPNKSSISFNGNQNIDELLRRITELETINAQLKSQNLQLRELNSKKMQSVQPNSFGNGTPQNQSGYQTPRSYPDNSQLLDKMNKKLMDLATDNNRLTNLLQDWKQNNEFLTRQNEQMKKSLNLLRKNGDALNSDDAQIVRNFYENLIEPEMRRSQTDILKQLDDFKLRLAKIQSNQRHIQNQLIPKSSFITPQRTKQQYSTDRMTQDPKQSYSNRKFDVNSFGGQDSSIQNQSSGCPRCAILDKKIQDLERQLRADRERPLSHSASGKSGKMKSSSENFLKNKVKQLEEQLESKIIKCSNLQKDLKNARDQLQRKTQRFQRDMSLLQSQLNTQKMALKQEKQKYNHIEDQKNQIEERCRALEGQLENNDVDSLKNELKAYYENKEEGLKNLYEQQLIQKDEQTQYHLQKYLQILQEIKNEIKQSDIDGMIVENQNAVNEKLTIEQQILLIQRENNRIIEQLKMQLTKKEEQILQLIKTNNVLRAENQQIVKQKEKLKQFMLEMDEIKPILQVDVKEPSENGSSKTKKYRSQKGCKLKQSLKGTLKKIDDLQLQITQILREDNEE